MKTTLTIACMMAALCAAGAVQKPSSKKTSLSDSELRELAKTDPDVKNAGSLYLAGMASSNNVERKQSYLKAAAACLIACGKQDIYTKRIKGELQDVAEFESELKDDCKQCLGTGTKVNRCYACKGNGQCPECKGTGHVRAVKYSGFNKHHVSKSCSKCNESGRCQRCDGKGSSGEKCLTCTGTGKELSKTVAVRVFHDLCTAIADGKSEGWSGANGEAGAKIIKVPPKGRMAKKDGQIVFVDGSGVIIPYGMTKLADKDLELRNIQNAPRTRTKRGVGRNEILKIAIPNSVVSIEPYAFSRCESLASVTIPDSVESIGRGAFEGCKSLKSVKLPSQLKSVKRSLFSGCSSLESVIIPLGVTNIESQAFCRCPSLKSISIPDSVDEISNNAFDKTCHLEKSEKRRNADRLAVVRKAETQFAKRSKAGNGTAQVQPRQDGIIYASIAPTSGIENFVVISSRYNPNHYAYSILIFPTSELCDCWYEAVEECTEKIKDWVRVAAEHKVKNVSKEIPVSADQARAFVIGITEGNGRGDLMRKVIRAPIAQLAEQFSIESVKFIGTVEAARDFKSYSVYIRMICGESFSRIIFKGSGAIEKIDEQIVKWLTMINPESLENARETQSEKEDLFQ